MGERSVLKKRGTLDSFTLSPAPSCRDPPSAWLMTKSPPVHLKSPSLQSPRSLPLIPSTSSASKKGPIHGQRCRRGWHSC